VVMRKIFQWGHIKVTKKSGSVYGGHLLRVYAHYALRYILCHEK
jgi:hypothetical protein